jgi:Tat protein secretion system quality control protein TatD with DNase activity
MFMFVSCRHILEIVAGVKEEDMEKLSNIVYQNTTTLFFPDECH